MTADEAAQEMAALINRIEGAGLAFSLSNGGHVDIEGKTVEPGTFEGDPWWTTGC